MTKAVMVAVCAVVCVCVLGHVRAHPRMCLHGRLIVCGLPGRAVLMLL